MVLADVGFGQVPARFFQQPVDVGGAGGGFVGVGRLINAPGLGLAGLNGFVAVDFLAQPRYFGILFGSRRHQGNFLLLQLRPPGFVFGLQPREFGGAEVVGHALRNEAFVEGYRRGIDAAVARQGVVAEQVQAAQRLGGFGGGEGRCAYSGMRRLVAQMLHVLDGLPNGGWQWPLEVAGEGFDARPRVSGQLFQGVGVVVEPGQQGFQPDAGQHGGVAGLGVAVAFGLASSGVQGVPLHAHGAEEVEVAGIGGHGGLVREGQAKP